jgi:hypothetical protein
MLAIQNSDMHPSLTWPAGNVRSYVRYPDTPSCRTRITIAAILSDRFRYVSIWLDGSNTTAGKYLLGKYNLKMYQLN